jgi:hypothetical protein
MPDYDYRTFDFERDVLGRCLDENGHVLGQRSPPLKCQPKTFPQVVSREHAGIQNGVCGARRIVSRHRPDDPAPLSLALAWMGTHWKRPELVWLLYGFMALGGYKLVTWDFMSERNLALVVSLLCYGGALILLPPMLRGKSAARMHSCIH